jgi:hypothetical protein
VKRTVYVGGVIDDGTPLHVWLSLELAMVKMLEFFVMRGRERDDGYPQTWECAFLSGEPHGLRWTFTMVDGRKLYIESFELDAEQERKALDNLRMGIEIT